MKTLIKIFLMLSLLVAPGFAQVYVAQPDAPQGVLSLGGDNMSEKEEQEYLSKITNPQVKKELLQIKELDRRKYYSLLRKTSFMSLPSVYSLSESGISFFKNDKDENDLRQKLSELEIYSEILGVKYENADQADKQKLAQQLKETLADIFDLREKQRKEEVEKLEKKLAELKESIKIRNDNKQQIVEDRFRTLTGKGKYLKWD